MTSEERQTKLWKIINTIIKNHYVVRLNDSEEGKRPTYNYYIENSALLRMDKKIEKLYKGKVDDDKSS